MYGASNEQSCSPKQTLDWRPERSTVIWRASAAGIRGFGDREASAFGRLVRAQAVTRFCRSITVGLHPTVITTEATIVGIARAEDQPVLSLRTRRQGRVVLVQVALREPSPLVGSEIPRPR